MIWLAIIGLTIAAGVLGSQSEYAARLVTRAWLVLSACWVAFVFLIAGFEHQSFWVAVVPPVAFIATMRTIGWVVRA